MVTEGRADHPCLVLQMAALLLVKEMTSMHRDLLARLHNNTLLIRETECSYKDHSLYLQPLLKSQAHTPTHPLSPKRMVGIMAHLSSQHSGFRDRGPPGQAS